MAHFIELSKIIHSCSRILYGKTALCLEKEVNFQKKRIFWFLTPIETPCNPCFSGYLAADLQ